MLLEQILIGLLLLIMAIQYGYMLFFYSAFPKKTGLKRSVEPAPVSLVICARNELENLRRCLPFWLKQDHPNYEVIVVNDRSWDASQEYLESLQESYPQLRVRNLYDDDRQWIGKKFALTIGIKAAMHERVVLTDADCLPSSNSHLRRMAVAGENKSIVLGYGGYSGKSPVAAMVQFETLASALHWMSWAKRLKPYMGVGRNLSYTRSLFLSKSGFSKHMHLPSGDDDLFISAVGKRRNTTVCLHPKAFTFSKPPESMAHWWRQKRRHLSTGHLYPFGVKAALALWGASSLAAYLLLAFIPWLWKIHPAFVGILAGRWLLYATFLLIAGWRLKNIRWIWAFPLLELLLMITQTRMHRLHQKQGAQQQW